MPAPPGRRHRRRAPRPAGSLKVRALSSPSAPTAESKICPRDETRRRAALLPRPLVFTNGVFDLLHRGHVECLAAARREGASLVVGLNSDRSVRGLGKGPLRPLVGEDDRAAVIAALEAVSLVVLFDEPTPEALIDELRPEVYVKGGDYRVESLREARQVAGWGGRAMTVDFVSGRSTTRLVETIARRAVAEHLAATATATGGAGAASAAGDGDGTPASRRAAFLDRDGVINADRGYVWRVEDFELLPGVTQALRLLAAEGYALVVVTNQSGIARGYYTEDDHAVLSAHLRALLAADGVVLAGIYHCPHHPQAAVERLRVACDCRKPAGGLIRLACAELGLDAAASLLVGDRMRDIAAGRDAGVGRCYLVGEHDADAAALAGPGRPDAVHPDLLACVRATCATAAAAPAGPHGGAVPDAGR